MSTDISGDIPPSDASTVKLKLCSTRWVIVLLWAVVMLGLGYQRGISLASDTPGPGYDYNEGHNSVRNLLVYKQSLHDVHRVLNSPELRVFDGGVIAGVERFWSENVEWGKRLVTLHPKQNHPVYLAIIFGIPALYEKVSGSYYYNIFQVVALFAIFALAALSFASIERVKFLACSGALAIAIFLSANQPGTALHVNLTWGQSNLTVMLLSAIFVLAYIRGHFFFGGAVLCIAASDKMLPLLLLVAVPPQNLWPVIKGMIVSIAAATFVLFSHAGIVVLLDVIRYPVVIWTGPYNMLTPKGIGWLTAQTDHSLTNGMRSLSLLLQATPGLILLGLIASLIIFFRGITKVKTQKGYALVTAYSLGAILGIVDDNWRSFAFLLLFALWLCDVFYRIKEVKDGRRKFIVKIIVSVGFLYPLVFKVFYEHHLIFSVIAVSMFLLLLVSRPRWSVATYVCFALAAASCCLLNSPWMLLNGLKPASLGGPQSGVLLMSSLRYTFLGLFLFAAAFHLWLRTGHFRNLCEDTGANKTDGESS